MKKYLLSSLIILICTSHNFAQAFLDIPTQNHCAFSSTAWEDEIYRFEVNPKVQEWVNTICEVGGVVQNFELVQASVENVAAIIDPITQKRYLLFSQNFIEKQKTGLGVYAALAHEIGHHVNLHRLTDAQRKVEEIEADQFMGYVLAKMYVFGMNSLSDAQKVLTLFPSSYPAKISKKERATAMEFGWYRAQKAQAINSVAFDKSLDKDDFLGADFPFPPPPCCSTLELPKRKFSACSNLGSVNRILRSTLQEEGYLYHRYMSVPNGFAIVTQMEQFKEDFTSCADDQRWSTTPLAVSFQGFLDYFKRLVMPAKANFRTFVFLITSDNFKIVGDRISKQAATDWYSQGINSLPSGIAASPYTDEIKVTAIVYEFTVPESNRKPNQTCPYVDTKLHLEKSGLWKHLRGY